MLAPSRSRRCIETCVLLILGLVWPLGASSYPASALVRTTQGPPAEQQTRPPNIVVVLVDDLRWDDIGAAGHSFVETPNIDRIAREGARFLNAFATTPLCSPSRASLLTGLYPHAHGIIDNTDRSAISHRLDTFPGRLQRAGYETAFIGKWHMGNDDSRRPGFDYWVAMKGQGAAIDPELNQDGVRATVEGYVTDILTERAVTFIERRRTEPFLVYLAHKALHPNVMQRNDGSAVPIGGGGFIPADRHRNLYAESPISRRPNAFVPPDDKPALLRRIGNLPPLGPETATSDRTIRERLEMLMAVDEGLGEILETLEEAGALDDTVVVVTSDHGYFYGEHGLSAERRLAYEETSRIPLLIRYPRLIPAGITPEQLTLSIDLAPTLLAIAGEVPGDQLHGRSVVPLLSGEAASWRTSFLIEYFSDTVFRRVVNMGYQAVRTERFKYIHYTDLEGMDELYDLEADPYEMRNLIDSPEARATLEQMKMELAALLERTG